jgi:uncharacterized protein (TIGR02118 family)
MPGKKLFGLLARKSGLNRQEFQDHYRHPHGTMGMRISTLRDYVQSHQVNCDMLQESQQRFECVAELWFDNEADLVDFRQEPTMVEYLNADEWRFVDMKRSKHFIGEEELLVSDPDEAVIQDRADAHWRVGERPVSVKLLQFFDAKSGNGWNRAEDLELGLRLGAYRHVRCHPTAPFSLLPDREGRMLDFSGARELWWPTMTVFERAARADPDAWQQLICREGAHTLLAIAERFR